MKLSVENKKTNTRLLKQIDLLGKDLIRLDDLYTRCKSRLSAITILKNEYDFTSSLMAETEPED